MKTFFTLIFLLLVGMAWGQAPRLVVPVGHTDSISSVAFSPDGKYVLTGSSDKTAKLWDLAGHVIQTFSGHTGYVTSVAFSPDGKTVLSSSSDKTAKLWDLNGHVIQTFTGHAESVFSVDVSSDGNMVVTTSDKVRLWNLKGHKIQTFSSQKYTIKSAIFSPDGKTILTEGYGGDEAILWDLGGHIIQTFSGHTGYVSSVVAFSPDGKTILTGGRDSTARLWDLKGNKIQTFSGHGMEIDYVAFSPDGKVILTMTAGSSYNKVKIWDMSGQIIGWFSSEVAYSSFRGGCSADFSPDGKMVFMCFGETTPSLWDLNKRVVQTFSNHASAVNSVAFSPDGKMVLIGNSRKSAALWELSKPKIQTFSDEKGHITSMTFSPDGKTVLTGSEDYKAKLWDLNGRVIQTFSGHTDYVSSVAFSPDGKTILTGGRDSTARLWDLDGREIQTFVGHSAWVEFVAFSPDGKMILTNYDTEAILWDMNGHKIQTLSHIGFCYNCGIFPSSMAYSPDGKKVIANAGLDNAELMDVNWRVIRTFSGHADDVLSVAFAPEGLEVLTGSSDYTAILWNLKGRAIQTFKGHANRVISVKFSMDGQMILTGSSDGTTKLWDVKSGKTLATLISLDSTDWVVTTPSGLFDASPGAMKLMYYVQGLDVIELDQLKERYYEPGLLAKIMGFDKGELRNVAAFDNVALYPEIKAGIEKDRLAIELTERNGGMGKLSLFVNGKELQEDINPKRLKSLSLDLNAFAKFYQTNTENIVALRAYNAEGWLKSQAYQLTYLPAAAKGREKPGSESAKIALNVKPRLYAVVVGTSNYAGERLDLHFADQDAEAMATALKGAGSALFGVSGVSVRLLSSNGATAEAVSNKANIEKAFKDFAAEAKPSDVLVVYFSGHGLAYGDAEKAQFYYLTKDIGSEDVSDPVVRKNYTISSEEFTQWLIAVPALKQVMIIDACNAGKVVESLASVIKKELDPSQIRAFDRMKDRAGMFILTGSAADKVSYEAGQYGQGLLTYSLLQGMDGLALTEDKRVDVMRLFQYARDIVPDLARDIGGIQTPVLAYPIGDGASFDIGIKGPGVNIPVAKVKPVFIRNIFQDENYGDELGLVKALEDYFRQATVKGAQADMIYVDVNEYESGYSIRGNYSYSDSGATVQVKGGLFKGKTLQGKFEVAGKKNDVPELVTLILDKVRPLIK